MLIIKHLQLFETRKPLSVRYIAKIYSKQSAIDLTKNIICRTKELEYFPKMGRVVPEVQNEEVRELIEGKYRIIYEMLDDMVLIAKIHHSSRNLRREFE